MLLLFDYDGVIADSFDSLLELCVQAQEETGFGRAPTAEDFQTIQNLTFDKVARLIGIPESQCSAFGEAVFARQQKGWKTTPFPAMVEVLPKLATQHTLAVVTNSQSRIVSAALEEFGLGSVMVGVAGGESGATKAERILLLQESQHAANDNTVMIGDTLGDIRAGKEAGVQTAGVTWGFQPRELLATEEPDYLLDHPEDMPTAFNA